ncbi:MAG: tetratricopeptide repeat protein [Deltaproteobacteria bacterium]|nr:tetratricopeptide repeat protein [Deltaproteobacteria bacterium]
MRAAAAILVVLLWAGPAGAAPRDADAHAARGKQLFAAQQWDDAIAEYQAAYDLDGKPTRLFNMAQAYRLKGDRARALELYRRYVALEPSGRGAPDARIRIAELERALAGSPSPEPSPSPSPDPSTAPYPSPSPSREPFAAPARSSAGDPFTPPRQVDRYPGQRRRTIGQVTFGVGVLAALYGLKYLADAGKKEDEINALTPGQDSWDPSLESSGSRASTYGWILTGGGLALTATAVYLWISGMRADVRAAERAARMSAAPLPGGAAVVVRGRF